MGSNITEHLDPGKEFKWRIELARAIFEITSTFLCNNTINCKVRQIWIRSYVWSLVWDSSVHAETCNNQSLGSIRDMAAQKNARNTVDRCANQ